MIIKNYKSIVIALIVAICMIAALPGLNPMEHLAFAEEGAENNQSEEQLESLSEINGTIVQESLTKYGNIFLTIPRNEAKEAGLEPGDVVTVAFLDQELELPLVTNYSDVDSGSPAVFSLESADYLSLAINMGDFATTYGIATKTTFPDKTYEWNFNEGVEPPIDVKIRLKEKAGYLDEYRIHQLSYSNERSDYPDITDEQFANFRGVHTTGIGKHTLYRTASPIDNSRGRSAYADEAIKNAGVTVVINLSDDEAAITAFDGFENTYYATAKRIGLNMNLDFMAADFRSKLAEGLKFMADNPGIYAIHCLEGKDRTGFVIGVLESLMGASYEEIVADYMTTFDNYYGVKPGDVRYDAISSSNIVKSLQSAFGVADLRNANLEAEAEAYLTEIGLSTETISALKLNLSGGNQNSAEGEQTPAENTEPTPELNEGEDKSAAESKEEKPAKDSPGGENKDKSKSDNTVKTPESSNAANSVPKTGDESEAIGWLILLMLAGATLMTVQQRKNDYRQ